MINSGVDVHMNYAGIAPDLGAFEFQPRGNAYKRFNFFFWLKRILMGYLL
jgi:hypothetical protein